MKREFAIGLGLLLLTAPAFSQGEEFLTYPERLHDDPFFAGERVYYVDDLLDRLPAYDSVMIDEPVIFVAPDSPYSGFKASDMASLSQMLRDSMARGLSSEPVSFGNYRVVDQPGAGTLYVRAALKNIYIRKNKRGLLSYTPVGAVVKGASDAMKDTLDKSTLVEMTLEAELQDSQSGDVLFAIAIERGQRADKRAKTEEEAVNWEATGAVAEVMGRRLACRLDNARRPADQHRDCIAEIPLLPQAAQP